MDITRKQFLKGVGAASLGAAISAVLPKQVMADEGKSFADSIEWDETYDVVVAGFGLGGANAAVVASDLGAKVLLLEKAPEQEAGGCSKYAGQLILSTEDPEEFYNYQVALSRQYEHVTDYEALKVYCDGAAENFDWLVKLGADPDQIGTMKMFEYPELEGIDSVKIWLVTGKNNDSGYYRFMKSNVEARSETIDVWYEAPVVHLIQDPETKTVLGVQAEKDGKILNIRSKGGVILATGGFENNPKMITNYLDMPYVYTWAALHNTGDGVKLGIEAGADLWHMGVCAGYFWAFLQDDADPQATKCYRMGSVPWAKSPARMGIIVGPNGERYMNEAQTHRHGRWQEAGEWITRKHPLPVYSIFDDDSRKEYLNTIYALWSENGEEEIEKGWIVKADTLEELAEKIGADPEKLVHACEDVNESFDEERNAQYERAFDTLTPIRTAPFFAIKLGPTMYNTDGGPVRNAKAEVIDTNGDPIPHLFSCGDCGSIFSHMYNGGGNIGECTVFGRIAGRNAVACVEGELEGVYYGEGEGPKPEFVSGSGEDTGVYEDGTYSAYGEGVNGRFEVKVTIADGKISAVEVGENGETEGIGTRAIEDLPQRIIDAQSYEIDMVSGATTTSRAILSAVKACLIEASK